MTRKAKTKTVAPEELNRALRFPVPAATLGKLTLQQAAEAVVLQHFRDRGLLEPGAERPPYPVQLGVAGRDRYTVVAAWSEPEPQPEPVREPEKPPIGADGRVHESDLAGYFAALPASSELGLLFDCMVMFETTSTTRQERFEQAAQIRRYFEALVGKPIHFKDAACFAGECEVCQVRGGGNVPRETLPSGEGVMDGA